VICASLQLRECGGEEGEVLTSRGSKNGVSLLSEDSLFRCETNDACTPLVSPQVSAAVPTHPVAEGVREKYVRACVCD
jgi:hypothetical protein